MILFAFFGLLPGSRLGGAAGIKFAGMLFGLPLEPGLLAKCTVLLSMLIGIVVSGIVSAMSTTGWMIGSLIDSPLPAPMRPAEEVSITRR